MPTVAFTPAYHLCYLPARPVSLPCAALDGTRESAPSGPARGRAPPAVDEWPHAGSAAAPA
eukprot:ctg_447.g228